MKKKLFKWREALRADIELKGKTKHVLAFLSFYMDEDGGSCFPSQRALASGAGLSRRTVYEHLKIAEKEGWILKTIHGLGGQGWKRHGYQANIPEKVGKKIPHVIEEGGEGDSPPFTEGGENYDIKVGKEIPLSTSMNTSYNTVPLKNLEKPKLTKQGTSKKRKSEAKTQNSVAGAIYEFYIKEISPGSKDKRRAHVNIEKYLKSYDPNDLITAIKNYKPESKNREPTYRKDPANFFGVKKGNEFFMNYLPGEFKQVSDADKPVNQQEWF